MKIQQIISGKVIAFTLILVSIVLTFAFVVTTIQSWQFENLGRQETRSVSEDGAQVFPTGPAIAPILTPHESPVPTSARVYPTPEVIQIPVSGLPSARIVEVLHIENGAQTLIKVYLPGAFEGNLYAEIEAIWSTHIFFCSFLADFPLSLPCLNSSPCPL
jgi:hypothetical protein